MNAFDDIMGPPIVLNKIEDAIQKVRDRLNTLQFWREEILGRGGPSTCHGEIAHIEHARNHGYADGRIMFTLEYRWFRGAGGLVIKISADGIPVYHYGFGDKFEETIEYVRRVIENIFFDAPPAPFFYLSQLEKPPQDDDIGFIRNIAILALVLIFFMWAVS